MMEAIKFAGEEALVAEAIGLAAEGFDFVADAFHAAVADPMFPPGEDAAGVAQEALAQLLPRRPPDASAPAHHRCRSDFICA